MIGSVSVKRSSRRYRTRTACGRTGLRDRASRFGFAVGLAGVKRGCRCCHASGEQEFEAIVYLQHFQWTSGNGGGLED